MNKRLVWLLLFLSVLVAEAWFLLPNKNWVFEWEPLSVFIISVAAFIGFEVKITRKQKPSLNPQDQLLINQINEVFIEPGFLSFLRDHDFGAAFRAEQLEPLEKLIHLNHDIEFDFINSKINKKWKALYIDSKKLMNHLAINGYFVGYSTEIRKIHPDLEHHNDIKKKAVNTANDLASQVYNSYLEYNDTVKNLK